MTGVTINSEVEYLNLLCVSYVERLGAFLVAAAVLYLYPARHTQAAPVFRDKPI